MTTDDWVQLGGLTAAAFAAFAAILVIVLHVLHTEVDPREDGVSAYALTPFGILYRSQVVATGVAGLLLACVLIAGEFESPAGAVVLGLFAVSRIAIARYPTDPRGTTTFSRSGRLHVLLAATTFVTIAVAAPWVSATLTGSPGWHGPTSAIVTVGWVSTVLALGTFATTTLPATRRVFGVVERGAYAGWFLWIVVTGLAVGGRI
jgi:hypothetical protein